MNEALSAQSKLPRTVKLKDSVRTFQNTVRAETTTQVHTAGTDYTGLIIETSKTLFFILATQRPN